jgi:3'(2'), 5'-bisphosphate nucleotidase
VTSPSRAAGWAEVAESARAGDVRAARRPLPDPAAAAAERGGLRVVASRSHGNEATEAFIRGLEAVYGPAERIPSGSSLKICRVAEGTADIYPRLAPTMEWDTAAAQAVLEAAGGRVVEYDAGMAAPDYLRPDVSALHPLRYTKASLLNPFFVALGGAPGRPRAPESRA